MPLSNDDVVGAVDALFVAQVKAAQLHPRAVEMDVAVRSLAVYVEQFHAHTGVPIPPEVQTALDWALDPERDAATGRRGNRR